MINKIKFDKLAVRDSFSRASATYDAYSDLQKEVAEELVKKNASYIKGKVLDIGSGTGKIVEEVLNLSGNSDIIGTDISLSMTKVAKGKTNSPYITADFEALPFKSSTFNTIISSLTFQWTPPEVNGFIDTYRVLKPDGTFIFSTLGEETLKELKQSVSEAKKNYSSSSMDFEKPRNIEEDLKSSGFKDIEIIREEIIKTYKSPWELFKTLKKIGATTPYHDDSNNLSKGMFLRDVSNYYSANYPSKDGGVTATYDVIYTKAIK